MRKIFLVALSLLCFTACTNQCAIAQFSKAGEAYERYAAGLIKAYDADNDGFLAAAEIGEMRRPIPLEADTDGDQKLSKQELLEYVSNKASSKKKPKVFGIMDASGGGIMSGSIVDGKAADGVSSNALTSDLLGGLIQQKETDPVFVQLELFEVASGADVREISEFARNVNSSKSNVDELIDSLLENSHVNLASSFSFSATLDKESSLGGQRKQGGGSCTLKTKIKSVEPTIKLHIDLQKFNSRATEMKTYKPKSSAKVSTKKASPDKEELEKMILQRVNERMEAHRSDGKADDGGSAKASSDSHDNDKQREELEELILKRVRGQKIRRSNRKSGSSRISTNTRSTKSVTANDAIQIDADVDCGANGVTAVHFASDDQHCLLIIRANKVLSTPKK